MRFTSRILRELWETESSSSLSQPRIQSFQIPFSDSKKYVTKSEQRSERSTLRIRRIQIQRSEAFYNQKAEKPNQELGLDSGIESNQTEEEEQQDLFLQSKPIRGSRWRRVRIRSKQQTFLIGGDEIFNLESRTSPFLVVVAENLKTWRVFE